MDADHWPDRLDLADEDDPEDTATYHRADLVRGAVYLAGGIGVILGIGLMSLARLIARP
jgi:hypothetical protein